MASPFPEAVVENVAVGDSLPAMPLYLDLNEYIDTPLESTYMAAFRGVPEFYREQLVIAPS